MNIFEKYNIQIPAYERQERKQPTQADIDAIYDETKDPFAAMARRVECYSRFRLTGKWEYVHPLGVSDCVIKSGVTVEVKTGHGWVIEPSFRSLEDLEDYLDERKNPLFKASHVAYLPYRATSGFDCDSCLYFTANQFLSVLGKFGKLQIKKSRDLWGVAMKPWITEGYVQKSSKDMEELIRRELNDKGVIIEEFADKMGITLYDIED